MGLVHPRLAPRLDPRVGLELGPRGTGFWLCWGLVRGVGSMPWGSTLWTAGRCERSRDTGRESEGNCTRCEAKGPYVEARGEDQCPRKCGI